jgi:hypothetical protein
MISTALATRDEQIAALEAKVMNELPDASEALYLPKLEMVTDKPMKRTMFYIGTKSGDKVPLGESVDVVYLERGAEVRALMVDGEERPRCAARDGIPYTEGKLAPSCQECRYAEWVNNKPFVDGDGQRCRAKRHITVEVVVNAPDGGKVLTPAVLVVPPTSLKTERQYRSNLASMGRITGGGTALGVLTHITGTYVRDTYEYSVMAFKNLGPAKTALTPEQYLLLLQDKSAFQDAKVAHEAYDDIASQQAIDDQNARPRAASKPPKPKAKPAPLSHEEAPGGGEDDDLPF